MSGKAVESTNRVMGVKDVVWLWFGMTAQMGVFTLGASFAGRIPYLHAIVAILAGNGIMSLILVLNGDVGMRYGLNFSQFLSAPFGYKGSLLPLGMRALTVVFWIGIQTYFGATAIDLAVKHLIGYSNWPIWYVLLGILQIWIAAGGIRWIKYLVNVSAPALGALSLWLIWMLVRKHSLDALINFEIQNPMSFWAAITANLSYWVTVAVNISDFTRHIKTEQSGSFLKRNRISILGQLPGVTMGMLLFASVGLIGGIFTGEANPVLIIGATLGDRFMLLGLVIVLLAQLSANVSANLYAGGNIVRHMSGGRLSFAKAVIIVGAIGLCTFPWLMLDYFLTYLPLVGATLAPLPGIMIADYYLLRRGRLQLRDFDDGGRSFAYHKGINPAAIITYIAAGAAGIYFLEYSWLVSLPLALILYSLLMRLQDGGKLKEV